MPNELTDAQRAELAAEIQEDGGLYCLGEYLAWSPGDETATLDGQFTAERLEAIAAWMRAHAR